MKKRIILAPSILAADFKILGRQMKEAEIAGAEYFHIDVMDGQFVPSISFGMPLIASIRSQTKRIFDVHLMIEEPIRYLEDFASCGADIITVHVEACKHLNRTVRKIKELRLQAGVALNPATSLSALDYILPEVSMVLLMSVNPGFGGQAFLPATLPKLKKLKELTNQMENPIRIEVDGGIIQENVEILLENGADVIVAGNAVFRGDIGANTAQFIEIFRRNEGLL